MKKIFSILVMMLPLLACNDSAEFRTLKHDNGLTLSISTDPSQVQPTQDGFVIVLSQPSNRSVNQISIRLQADTVAPSGVETKTRGGQKYLFKRESADGGSGGREQILCIWKPLARGGVLLVHHVQAESENLDFEMDWQIIESTRLAT